MSDMTTPGDPATSGTGSATPPAAPQAAVTPPAESGTDTAPAKSVEELAAELERAQAALKAANAEAAERRHKLAELEKAQKDKERAGMDEAQRLAAELEDAKKAAADKAALAGEVEALRAAVQAQVDALTKELNVPKHIAPLMASMTPAQKLAYLTENRTHFARPTTPSIDAADRGRGGASTETPEQRQARLQQRFPSLARR